MGRSSRAARSSWWTRSLGCASPRWSVRHGGWRQLADRPRQQDEAPNSSYALRLTEALEAISAAQTSHSPLPRGQVGFPPLRLGEAGFPPLRLGEAGVSPLPLGVDKTARSAGEGAASADTHPSPLD